MIKRETWALVVPISLLPAIWAVVANFVGITTAAAAMIAATIYVISAKGPKDGLKMSLGAILGVAFAVLSFMVIGSLPLPMLLSMCIVLIIMVALVVIIHSFIAKYADLFMWLCAFAVAMTVMGLMDPSMMMSLAIQLTVSMLVGIWWIGFLGCMIMGAIAKPKDKAASK